MMEVGEGEGGGGAAAIFDTLRTQFGSSEEFGEFERQYYSQREEVKTLRQNLVTLRSVNMKLQEEKRTLELQLVSEKTSRDQDSRNAVNDLEKNQVQLNSQIHSMKCEVEMWKRKTEAVTKEAGWLKEQLKAIELEKSESMRKVEELTRQNNAAEHYRTSMDVYLKKTKEKMEEVQKRLEQLERERETFVVLMEGTEKHVKRMQVNVNSWEHSRGQMDSRIDELEKELISVKSELVQNNAELRRTKDSHLKTDTLVNKLLEENKDLNEGFSLLISSLDGINGDESVADVLKRIPEFHDQIVQDVASLDLDRCESS